MIPKLTHVEGRRIVLDKFVSGNTSYFSLAIGYWLLNNSLPYNQTVPMLYALCSIPLPPFCLSALLPFLPFQPFQPL